MAKHNKSNLKKIILIGLILIFTIGCIFIGSRFYHIYISKKSKNILDEIEINEELITDEITRRILQIKELQILNSDIIGWIEIEGTDINYPVAQTTDNDFYMNHDYKKEYNEKGTLFLDESYEWETPNTNKLIYGHNNQDGTGMFHALLKYKDENFYKEHPNIKFTTNLEDSQYEIIAVFKSRVYYKSEKNVFRYYYFINAQNEEEFNEYIQNCKKSSIYDTGKTAIFGDELITLSTCAYHTEDGRFAIVAKKVK